MPPIDTPPTRPGRIARGAGAFAGFLLLVLWLTPSALAGVVSAEGGTLRYASDPGEDDSVDVYYEAVQNRYVLEALRDSSEPPRTRAGPGCEDQGESAAGFGVRGQRFTCSAAGVSAILLDIGDNPASGYQSATAVGALPAPVTLRMGPGRGALVGSRGDDLIEVSGDAVSYLQGQAGADTIRGGSATDRVNGGSGDDHIEGGAGVDTLYGDCCGEWEVPAGPDTGPDGNDRIDGGAGNDNMIGGAGDDILTADARNDKAWCDDYTGEYAIGEFEGPPVPRQAPGDTFNTVDAENDGEGCETVNLAAPEPRPGGAFSASVPRQRHSAVMKSGLKFVARAPTRGTVTAALRLDDATRKKLGVPRQVGRVFKRPVSAGANTITVPLGQPFKNRLRRPARLKLTLNVRYTDAGGTLTVIDKTIVLRRR